ncbi:hypothetical protein [Halorussus litoreus]|uniref:hypothetical protein n=1 Tax=Halorussus litoreus TaxID=1710536 RepID=UPI000E24C3B9|nr:hypothetical protein [Halorussus litoreus]
MQGRAATVYAVLFLVIAAGAYSLIGVAEQPGIDLEGETYTEGQNVTVNGYEYNVSSIGDGEGTLARVNESSVYTQSLENNSTTQLANTTYRVLIPNTSDPNTFTLREEFNLSENVTTTTQDGVQYVVQNGTDGNRTLVPRDQYERQQFGEPETREFAESDTFDYRGNETTVTNVTVDAAQLQYTAPRALETPLVEGNDVDLGPDGNNQTYVAHFPDDSTLQLTTDVDAYDNQAEEIDHFNERIAGLWGIVILSAITLALLFGMAFLPNK